MTISFKNLYEIIDEMTIEIDMAKPFRMLSAQEMTAAISKPPKADSITIKITKQLKPTKNSFFLKVFVSNKIKLPKLIIEPKKPVYIMYVQ